MEWNETKKLTAYEEMQKKLLALITEVRTKKHVDTKVGKELLRLIKRRKEICVRELELLHEVELYVSNRM